MKFEHGQMVRAVIDGTKIDDARISIDKDGRMFLCQNVKDGAYADDKLGYQYSWFFCEGDSVARSITLRDGFYPVKGDVIVYKGARYYVQEVVGDLVFYSSNQHTAYGYEHRLELERCGWKIEGQEQPQKEYSMDEVAKALGVPVEKLRIKKEA
jgi:signal peptidase I